MVITTHVTVKVVDIGLIPTCFFLIVHSVVKEKIYTTTVKYKLLFLGEVNNENQLK